MFLTNAISTYKDNIMDMVTILEVTTPTSEMKVHITFDGYEKNNNRNAKITVKQNILKNNIWYKNLYGIKLDHFKQPDIDIENIGLPYQIEAHLTKSIDDWSMFEVPLYICKLKNIYQNASKLPYIASYTSMKAIPDEYELLYTQRVPHETYMSEISKNQPELLDFTQIFRLISNTLQELKTASTKQEVENED